MHTPTGEDWPHRYDDDDSNGSTPPPPDLDPDMLAWLAAHGLMRPPGVSSWTLDVLDIPQRATEPMLPAVPPVPAVPVMPPAMPPPRPRVFHGPSPEADILARRQAVMLAALRSDASRPAPLRVLRWVRTQVAWLMVRRQMR